MINLMSPNDRKELAAARTNSLLLRYVGLIAILIGVLIVEIGLVYAFLSNDKANNEAIIAENATKTAAYSKVSLEAEEFRKNLATSKYILDKRVPYVDLILTIANNLPAGSILETIALDPSTFGTETSIQVKLKSRNEYTAYDDTIKLRAALQDIKVNDTPLFESVSFDSVSRENESTGDYKQTASYKVIFSKKVLAQ